MVDILAAVQQSKAADPNIILPALFASIPVTLVALGGFVAVLARQRQGRNEAKARDDKHQALIATNHGMRPGEYLELLGPMALWAITHTDDDNSLRKALGLPDGQKLNIDAEILRKLREASK